MHLHKILMGELEHDTGYVEHRPFIHYFDLDFDFDFDYLCLKKG